MTFRRILLSCLFATVLLVVTQTAQAQDRNFGIGAAIGGPDGISYKAWVNENAAVSGLLTFSLSDLSSSFYTHLDYLGHRHFDDLDWEAGRLHFFYGGGVGYQWYDALIDDIFSLRVPLGFGFNFVDVPVDLFFEVAPTFNVSPDFSFQFNGNLGFRFYLN